MNRRYVAAIAVCVPLAFACAYLAWRIFTLGAADHWAIAAPARALSWRSNAPDALDQAAEEQFAAGHFLPAQRLAKLAIAAYPLDGAGYRVLARIADRAGESKRALQLFRIAAIRSPRDLSVHEELAERAIKAGHDDEGLHQFDLVMRLAPAMQDTLLPRIAGLAGTPAMDAAIVRMLATGPPWRARFLSTLAAQGRDSAMARRIFGALDAMGSAALTVEERQDWIDRQISDHAWAAARVAWISSLPASQQRALGNLFDGRFEFPASGSGFGWRMTAAIGIDIRTAALSNGQGGHALTIEFSGARTPQTGISQLLALVPGRYLLHGHAQANQLQAEGGLQWTIICAEGSQEALLASPRLAGTQPWSAFATPFEVPVEQCGGQWLRLEVGAPYRATGQAAYAKLEIDSAVQASKQQHSPLQDSTQQDSTQQDPAAPTQ